MFSQKKRKRRFKQIVLKILLIVYDLSKNLKISFKIYIIKIKWIKLKLAKPYNNGNYLISKKYYILENINNLA